MNEGEKGEFVCPKCGNHLVVRAVEVAPVLSSCKKEYQYLLPLENKKFPPIGAEIRFYHNDVDETLTRNEKPSPEIMTIQIKSAATGLVYHNNTSGRGPFWMDGKFKSQMEEIAMSLKLTDQELENVKRNIFFGPEMNMFSLKMFSKEIVKNLPENHPAWKPENKQAMDDLFLDMDHLPKASPGEGWIPIHDADGGEAFWHDDKYKLYDWLRQHGFPTPAITDATKSKLKWVMPTGEKIRAFSKEKNAWVVPFAENDPRLLEDTEIIRNYIKQQGFSEVYTYNPVATAHNIEVLDENGMPFGKGTSAQKATQHFAQLSGTPLEQMANLSRGMGDSNSDGPLAIAIGAGFVFVRDSSNKVSDKVQEHMVAQAKPGCAGIEVALEAIQSGLAWLNLD